MLTAVLIAATDFWAVGRILKEKRSTGAKIGWCLLVLLLPALGVVIWYATDFKN